jgi:hypothetical protein
MKLNIFRTLWGMRIGSKGIHIYVQYIYLMNFVENCYKITLVLVEDGGLGDRS